MAVSEVFRVLVVNIGPIRDESGASLQAELSCDGSQFGQPTEDVEFSSPVRVSAEVTCVGSEFVVKGRVSGTLGCACSRCLAPTPFKFNVPLVERYRELDERGDQESDDEVRSFTGDGLDLTDSVRDAVVLALPLRVLCRDDCAGLCPMCGIDLNTSSCGCSAPIVSPFGVLAKLVKQ
jgi:uncharacterized protein